ncbi:MAG: bifunctional ornithine acetyltransferase/N-acetylglutamate synthase [Lachnospiraceae bacterium]
MSKFTMTDGGVTAPKGYMAAGLRAGIKPGKSNKDMAMIYSTVPAKTAGVFTRNKVKAAPVLWGMEITEKFETAQAIVVNSGVANACTGALGLHNVMLEAEKTADLLEINKESVLVGSTGVIGAQLPMDVILGGIEMLVPALSDSKEAATDAATAILTTDTHKKELAFTFEIDGKTVTIGGMCKGSGMIHPNMGTMLGYITTDLAISKELLVKALKQDVEDTFNMVSVDGDTSTNDTVYVLANGLAGNEEITEENEDYQIFYEALHEMNTFLAKQIAGDGEGCTRLLEVTVDHAASKEDAVTLSKSVVTSSLTKAAVYGMDANWGRILCALGYSGAELNPETVDIMIESEHGAVCLVKDGFAADYSEEEATKILSGNPVKVYADVHMGAASATAWGCDLTYDYVKINADYRS